jgi:bifunctional N-acetylglucosamine-1-phosphate-uridyltransferase/glucosamine-1-phosphate-acetyltransferase GlmU-like protein
MDNVESAHFNYVGDSILGTGAHLGAGVILANLRLDRGFVPVAWNAGRAVSGLKKLGAMIGEYAEIGCNAVLQPGAIIGKRAMVAPTVAYGGFLDAEMIAVDSSRVKTFPRR